MTEREITVTVTVETIDRGRAEVTTYAPDDERTGDTDAIARAQVAVAARAMHALLGGDA